MTSVARTVRSQAERVVALEVAQRAFAPEAEPSRFVAERLSHLRRHVATQWVLESEGRIVSSLLAHPLHLRLPDGRDVDGIGLGSVATDPDARGQGFAEALCRAAVEAGERDGAPLALLFSAIGTRLYERLGFRTAAGWGHVSEDLEALAAEPSALEWSGLDPRAELDTIRARYDAAHAGTLHARRDETAWHHSLGLNANDWWLGTPDRSGLLRLEVQSESKGLYVSELLLADPSQAAPALVGLARVARRWGLSKIVSWLPPTPGLERHFEDRGRARTLPMLRGEAEVEALRIWPSDYF